MPYESNSKRVSHSTTSETSTLAPSKSPVTPPKFFNAQLRNKQIKANNTTANVTAIIQFVIHPSNNRPDKKVT